MHEFKEDKDKDENLIESHQLRRMYQTMMLPVPKLQNKYQEAIETSDIYQKF